ncbi:MAG: hypothetical protein K2M27_12355 [Muribaculaceae bacterium]|nr:hypothetical protein [Muribaculaceae bacterium]MDE6534311.1 hypothetical protein [Muribaculaceae bacterium]
MKENLLVYIAPILLLLSTAGCSDDFDFNRYGGYTDGQSDISATLSFSPYSNMEPTRATEAFPGDGMREITDFAILVYDSKGELIEVTGADGTEDTDVLSDLNFTIVDRTDSDAANGSTTEPKTGQASFNWKFGKWGDFYIYVAANMGRWNNEERVSSTLDVLKNDYLEDIKTVEGLRTIELTWDPDNYLNNRQMLGFMTTDNAHRKEAPLVKIDKPGMKLHAWLKRAASKVTIDYDGSGLRENVMIYLKQAVIRNIPKKCLLGDTNTPKDTTETLYATETHRLEEDKSTYGHHIDYFEKGNETDYTKWPMVAKSSPKIDHPDVSHADEAKALFFYENCQGDFSDDPQKEKYDKRQYPADDGTVKDYADMRDNVPAGAYIEVEGWYQNNNAEDAGNGRIIYRFMLGKDVKYNFDAERNTHYKVTLKFKGNGNDFDWHIDYKEEKGFSAPNPYFISYLYDESMILPLRYNGDLTGKKIKAEIIQNHWYPKDAPAGITYYGGWVKDKDEVWNGFLSLKNTTKADIGNDKTLESGYNKEYWNGNGDDSNGEQVSPRGEREYETASSETPYGNATDGYYTVSYDAGKGSTLIGVPLFTRAKTLVSRTGYTGNNPYSAYRRYAKVRFSIVGEESVPGNSIEIEIIQVTRVINPKAIYRSNGCAKPFKVILTKLTSEEDSVFTKIQSIGPWSAKIVSGGDWFKINGDNTNSKNITADSVRGGSGSTITFTYSPNGTNSGEPRCGEILVRYHNETCLHRIFVRQGYDPIRVTDNGVKIHTFNLRTKDTEVENPLDEGSLFRYGTEALDYPIDACENVADGFKDHTTTELTIAGKTEKTAWNKIPSVAYAAYAYPPFNVKNKNGSVVSTGRLLKGSDIDSMKAKKDIGYGFGVAYGDESTETAMTVAGAYEFRVSGTTAGRGIRCLVLYNMNDGRNVIFPIGASGYGRRRYGNYYTQTSLLYTKEFKGFVWGDDDFRSGVVRYAHRTLPMDQDQSVSKGNVFHRPLFWDLYKRPGANYWLNEYKNANGVFDINFFTFDTGLGDSNHCNIEGSKHQSDACFLRVVEE